MGGDHYFGGFQFQQFRNLHGGFVAESLGAAAKAGDSGLREAKREGGLSVGIESVAVSDGIKVLSGCLHGGGSVLRCGVAPF